MKKIRAKVHAKWQRFHKRRLGEKVVRSETKITTSRCARNFTEHPRFPRNFLDIKFA